MAFPSSQLPLYAGIAPGADPASPGGWSFEEITDDVREAGGVEIAVGRQDEMSRVDTTQTRGVVDNRAGHYSRVNPVGQWYGLLDKGTPAEYRVTRINDTFTRTVGAGLGTDADSGLAWTAGGGGWSVSSNAAQAALATANSLTLVTLPDVAADDVEVTAAASLSAVTTGAAWVHSILLRYTDLNNYYRLHTEFHLSGVIAAKIVRRVGGVSTDLATVADTGVTYTAGTVIHSRVRAVGSTLQLRVWEDGDPEPSTWNLSAEDDDLTGQTVGLMEWRLVGNTNAGTLTCTVDDFRADVIRASTPVPEWPVRWDMSGHDVTAPIVGAGILRRLSQGASALRSPIYRQMIAQPGAGYWPLEDGSDATAAAAALPSVDPATVTDGSFGNSDSPPGAASAVLLNTAGTSQVAGRPGAWAVGTDGYAAMCYLKLGSAPGSDVNMFEVLANGRIVRWLVQVSAANFTITGYDGDGVAVVSSSTLHLMTLTDWFAIQLETEEDGGGNVDWVLIWHQVGSTTFYSPGGTYTGSADRIRYATVFAPVNSTGVSHLWAGGDELEFVDTGFMQVSAGYAGETAGARLTRLAGEEGVPLRMFGAAADTAAMGAQRPATLLDLLRECEDADQGILCEAGAGLGYVTRESRYNQTPVMTLDFDDGHVAEPPEPTDDDQRLRNLIRLSRTGGSEATAQDDASISRSGIYSDELTVNLHADADLPYHAQWRLHMGTGDDLRWPRIVLDLARNPDLIADWCKVRVGSRITISNPPAAVGSADLDLIVEGWTEMFGAYSWLVVLACSPAAPWMVGIWDDADSLWGSASSTLKTTVTSGGTSATFRTADVNDVWSTTETPYDVIISGQRNTVTAMGAASLVSGAYDQAATLTRGVDGIVKALPAGSEIHLADGRRYAL